MKKSFVVFPALVLAAAALANAQTAVPTKVAIINIQQAIIQTKDGQKAQQDLGAKFGPKRAELEKKQSEVAGLQDQLKKGSATMNEEAQAKIRRDIDTRTTALKRDSEDFDSDVQEEEGKLMQELGGKVMKVLEKFASDNGFAVVLDVSNPQTSVLWRATAVDITTEIVALYDKTNPVSAAPAPAAKAPAASGPARAPAAPAAPPKKQ